MLKVYYLRQLKDIPTNTEYTEGQQHISHAISETTENPNVRRVIIEENTNLQALALVVEDPTQQDLDNYNTLPAVGPVRNLIAEIEELKANLSDIEKAIGVGTPGISGIATRVDGMDNRIKALGG